MQARLQQAAGTSRGGGGSCSSGGSLSRLSSSPASAVHKAGSSHVDGHGGCHHCGGGLQVLLHRRQRRQVDRVCGCVLGLGVGNRHVVNENELRAAAAGAAQSSEHLEVWGFAPAGPAAVRHGAATRDSRLPSGAAARWRRHAAAPLRQSVACNPPGRSPDTGTMHVPRLQTSRYAPFCRLV